MPKKRKLSPGETIAAVYRTLKDEGVLPPETPDEVAQLEDELGVFPKSTLSAADALKIAKGQLPLPSLKKATSFPDLRGTINDELGVAARGSAEIPPPIWEKMRKDRERARHERGHQGSKPGD